MRSAVLASEPYSLRRPGTFPSLSPSRSPQVDSIGDAYIVIALGDADLPPSPAARQQLLSAAIAMRAAVRRFDAAAAAAAAAGNGVGGACSSCGGGGCASCRGGGSGSGGAEGRLLLRIGVAEGDVIAGVTGAHRQRFQCLGHALAHAERLQRAAAPDEIRVHPAVAAAAAGERFRFAPGGAHAEDEGIVLAGETGGPEFCGGPAAPGNALATATGARTAAGAAGDGSWFSLRRRSAAVRTGGLGAAGEGVVAAAGWSFWAAAAARRGSC